MSLEAVEQADQVADQEVQAAEQEVQAVEQEVQAVEQEVQVIEEDMENNADEALNLELDFESEGDDLYIKATTSNV